MLMDVEKFSLDYYKLSELHTGHIIHFHLLQESLIHNIWKSEISFLFCFHIAAPASSFIQWNELRDGRWMTVFRNWTILLPLLGLRSNNWLDFIGGTPACTTVHLLTVHMYRGARRCVQIYLLKYLFQIFH